MWRLGWLWNKPHFQSPIFATRSALSLLLCLLMMVLVVVILAGRLNLLILWYNFYFFFFFFLSWCCPYWKFMQMFFLMTLTCPFGFAFVPYCFLKKTPIFLHKAKKEKAADDRFYAVNMGQTTLFRSWWVLSKAFNFLGSINLQSIQCYSTVSLSITKFSVSLLLLSLYNVFFCCLLELIASIKFY